jgi:DNA-binding response OmpR family regulator
MRSLLYYYLKKFGYRIKLCKDGQELVEVLGRYLIKEDGAEKIDLIVSDIKMPYASGLRILKELNCVLSFPPMILITAFGSDEIHKEAKKLGAVEVFDKPFNIEHLLLKIEELVPSYPFTLKYSNK